MGKVRRFGNHRPWTKEEEERLIVLSEKKCQSEIAKELGRTVQSVKSKRARMNMEPFKVQTEKLTQSDVARLVGVDKGTIYKTWKKYGIHFTKNGPLRIISEKRLIEFMKNNPRLWRASRCDYYFFCQYDWFLEKLEKEKSGEDTGTHYMNKRNWTTYEISRFNMLKKRGFSHREIAAELGRTQRAIDHLSIKMNRSVGNVG